MSTRHDMVRSLFAAGCLVHLLVGEVSALTIRNSPGGSGDLALALAQEPDLIIDGPCRSACAWGALANPHVCATSRASFMLHRAHDPGTGAVMNAATGYFGSQLPSRFQPYVAKLATHDTVEVPINLVRRCGGAS